MMKKVKNSQLNNANIKSGLYATSGPTPHVEVRAYTSIDNGNEKRDCDLRRKNYTLVHDFLPKTVISDEENIDIRDSINHSIIKKNTFKKNFIKKDVCKEKEKRNTFKTEKKCCHNVPLEIPKICESNTHLSKFSISSSKNERLCKPQKTDTKCIKHSVPTKYNKETYQTLFNRNKDLLSTTNSSGLSENKYENPDAVLEIYHDLYLYRKKLLKEKTGETSTNKISSNTIISSTSENTQEIKSETLTSLATNSQLVGLKHTVNVPDEAKIAIQSENTVVEEKKEKRVKEQQYPLDKYINFTSKNICDTLKLPPTCSDITQNEIDTEHLLRSVDETLESLQLDIETFVNRTVAKFSNLSTTKYSDDEKLHVNRLINKWMTENRINYENNRLDKTFVKSITSISDAPNSHKHYNSLNTVTDIVVNTKKQNIRNSKPNDTTKKLIKESPQSRKDQRHTLHLHEHTQQPSVVIPKLSPENLSNESSKPTNLLKRLIIQDMPSINIRNALKIQHTGSINLTPNENQRHQKSTNIGVFNITHSDSSSDVSQQVFMIDNGPANSRPRNLQNPAESNFSICSDTDSQGDIQVTITVPNTDIHYVEENEGNISTQITPILNSQENKVDNSYHSENLTERHEVINTIESCHNSEESQQTFETKSMIPAANANKKSEQTNVAKSAEINEAINHHHLNDKTVLDTLLSKNSIEEFQETSETKSVSNNEIKNNSIEKTNVIGMIEPLKAQQINNKEVVRTSPPVDTSKSPVNDGTLKNTNILGVFETNTLVLTEIIDLLNKIKQQKCCCLTNHNHEDYQMVDRSKSGEETITKSIKMKQYSNSDKILEKDFSSDSTLTRIEELIYINKDSDEGEESSEKILKLSGILKTNTSTQSPNSNTSSTAASNKTNLLLRKVSFTNLEELTTQNEPIQSPKSITQSVQTDSSIILETDKVNYEFNKKNEHKLTKDIKQNVDKETNTGTPLNMTGCSNLTQTTLNSIDQGKNIVININPVPLSYSNNDVVKRTFTENINKYKEFGVQTDKSSERKESEVGITQEQIEQPKFFELGSIKKPTSIPFNQKSLETQALNTSKVDEICQDMNASIQALLAETSVKTSPFKNISIEYQDFANQFILDTVNSVRIPISNATSNAIENQNIAHKNKNKVLGNKDKSYRNKNVDSSNSSSLYTTTSLSEGEIRQPCNCSCSLGEIHTCTIPTSLSTPKSNKKPKKSTVSPEMFQRDNPHLRIQKTRKHKNWHCIYTTSQSSSSIDESSDYSK